MLSCEGKKETEGGVVGEVGRREGRKNGKDEGVSGR